MQTFYTWTRGNRLLCDGDECLFFGTQSEAIADAKSKVGAFSTVWEVTGRPISKVRFDGIVEEAL